MAPSKMNFQSRHRAGRRDVFKRGENTKVRRTLVFFRQIVGAHY